MSVGDLSGQAGIFGQVVRKATRYAQPRYPAGRSINLSLSARGIHALSEVGLDGKIKSDLIAMPGRMLHRMSGELQYQPYGKNQGDVHYSVSRGVLNRLLLNTAEATGKVSLFFNEQCTELNLAKNRMSFRNTTDGSMRSIDFEVVIGTDGAGSAVCRALVEANAIEYRHEPLAHGYKELTIPADANGKHRIEKNALHIWPRGGYMLIALPNTDSSFTVTLFLPHKGPVSFESLVDEQSVADFFRAQYPDAVPLIPRLTTDFMTNQIGELGTIRCKPWHASGKIMLLGDAAHAVVPFHGQGMNCAFEDCSEFNRCLDRFNNWDALFQALDEKRRPNANAIADMALENYIEMRESVRNPKFHLHKKIEWLLEERHPDRFIARYSMVMFHRIPYAQVQQRGEIQAAILERLSANAEQIDDVDIGLADQLVKEKLNPIEIV